MEEFIQFITSQLIKVPFELNISNNKISIKTEAGVYQETLFNFDEKLSSLELTELIQLSNHTLAKKTDLNTALPIIKCWYLITHEKYFIEDVELDKYGRIGQSNLIEEFQLILRVPIADVLRNILQVKLSAKNKVEFKTYLTCDYDILNIWDIWGLKTLMKEVLRATIKFEFTNLFHLCYSYLFSRVFKSANGYLNTSMFDLDKRFTNVAFLIASPENKEYDGTICYSNSLVQKFLTELKNKQIHIEVHANYNTKDKPSQFKRQISDFQKLFNDVPLKNRHHYLRFIFPEYLETLEIGGIEQDFSMYFPESTLFRTGTCSEFRIWNFKKKRPYSTIIIPTTLMDGTFTDYLNCDLEQAKKLACTKLDLALKYSDAIVLLWHNRSMHNHSGIPNNYHPQLYAHLLQHIKYNLSFKTKR